MFPPEKLEALERAAESWRGTPFCEGTPVKGAGVSCHHLVAQVLFEAELTPRIAVPNGPRNWSAQSRSLIAEWIDSSGLFVRVDDGAEWRTLARARQPADVLGFRVVNAIHHAMISLPGGRVVHSLVGHGARVAPCIPCEWERRLEVVWRLRPYA